MIQALQQPTTFDEFIEWLPETSDKPICESTQSIEVGIICIGSRQVRQFSGQTGEMHDYQNRQCGF